MRRTRILTVACLVLCALAARAFGGDDSPSAAPLTPLTDEDRALFQWWDDLGYPDLSKLPFGNAWLGSWIHREGDPPVQEPRFAWRVRDSETSIDVLTLDLRSHHVQKRETEGEPWNRRGFDALDLVERAPAWAGSHGPPASWRKAVLARACAGQGRDDLAKRFLDAAQADGPEHPAPKSAGLPDRHAWVREQIGKNALDALVRSLPDERRAWSEIRVEWGRAARHFAHDANRADLESGLVALKSMVADEAARAEDPLKAWKDVAEGERIPWLIHEMQEAKDLIRDGRIYWGDSADADPPAHQRLAEMGFAAVPALLAALEDARLTGMVDSHERSSWSLRRRVWLDVPDVLHVGDLAWQTLDRISGGVLATDAEREACTRERSTRRARAAAWFIRVEPMGEARALADAVRGGSWQALQVADRLARLDPALAVPALETGATASQDSGAHLAVLRLAEIPGDAATDALLRLLSRLPDPDSAVRKAAIEAIEARGLAAFPAVLQAIHAHEAGAPGGGPLEALARRLSFVVAEAVLTEDSAPADDAFRASLAASVGKRFSGSLYTALLRLGTTERPPGTFGLRVVAERLDAGRGVSIRITLFEEPQKRYQVGSWGIHRKQPVVHRRGETSFGNGGWDATETIRTSELGMWTVRIDSEIEASDLDDDFLVDGRAAFER